MFITAKGLIWTYYSNNHHSFVMFKYIYNKYSIPYLWLLTTFNVYSISTHFLTTLVLLLKGPKLSLYELFWKHYDIRELSLWLVYESYNWWLYIYICTHMCIYICIYIVRQNIYWFRVKHVLSDGSRLDDKAF